MNKRGFFAGSQLVTKAPIGLHPKCGACGLHKKCNSPKLPVEGKGERGIMVVGEGPSAVEDDDGTLWGDAAGKKLRTQLQIRGIDLDEDCWSTKATICHTTGKPGDDITDYCRPNLTKAIKERNPSAFLVLGDSAVRSLIGALWREAPGSIHKWQGWTIPCQKLNAWILPTFRPEFVLKEDNPVLDQMFEDTLERLSDIDARPFETLPDEKREVELILDPAKAAHIIRKMIERGGTVAFDYETNMLKPDSPEATIVSCSVCWNGKKTIAFPWLGEAITATRELLRSPLAKIASNLKFEERWTRRLLKTRVRNWWWDTMVAAHVIDNRPGITSIKFQSFVLLGSDIWDDHVSQFLHTKEGSGDVNQILEQVDLNDLLLYNGLDSLLEYRVAEKQMKHLKYPLPKGMKK